MKTIAGTGLVVLLLAASTACGTEIGRVSFAGLGDGEARVMVDASKEIDFWTELDIKFTGESRAGFELDGTAQEIMGLLYLIRLYTGSNLEAEITCNPFDRSISGGTRELSLGSSHSLKTSGKMRCSDSVKLASEVLVKVKLKATGDPENFTVKKADLVIKQ